MYTRYDQDLSPFLEHMRDLEAERSRQRFLALRAALSSMLERCRRVCGS